jgi:DNA repair exonuclease SbcCD ATPase subunit
MGTKDLKNEVAMRMTSNFKMFNSRVSTGFNTPNGESGLNTDIKPKARGNNRGKTNIAIPKGPSQLKGVGRMTQSNTGWAGRPSFNIGGVDAKLAGQKAEIGWSNADTFGDRQQKMEFKRLTRGNKDDKSKSLIPTIETVETENSGEPEILEKAGNTTVNKSKVKFTSGDDENTNSYRSRSKFGSNDLIITTDDEHLDLVLDLDLEEREFYDEPELKDQNPFIGQVTPFHALLAKHMLAPHTNYDTPQWAPKTENSVASLKSLKPGNMMAGLALHQFVGDFMPYKKMVDESVELNMRLLDLESELKDANERAEMNFTAVMEKSELQGKKMIFAKAQGALKSINGRINEILSTSGLDSEASRPKPKQDPLHKMESFQTRDFSEDVLAEQIDHLKAKLLKLELHMRNLESHSSEISQTLQKKESELLNLESANSSLNSKLDVIEVSKNLDQRFLSELQELLESKQKTIQKFESGEKTLDSELRALKVTLKGSLEENGKLASQVTGFGLEVEKREKIIVGLKLRVDG